MKVLAKFSIRKVAPSRRTPEHCNVSAVLWASISP